MHSQKKIHTHSMEGHRKFLGGGEARVLETKYKAKLELPGGREVQNKKFSVGVVWIFSETNRHCVFLCLRSLKIKVDCDLVLSSVFFIVVCVCFFRESAEK